MGGDLNLHTLISRNSPFSFFKCMSWEKIKKINQRVFVAKNLILYSNYLDVVIELGMRSAKDKPMTKKERAEKRRKRKEKRLKK